MERTRQVAASRAHDKNARAQLSALETRRQVIEKGLIRVRAVGEITGMSRAEIYRLFHAATFRFRRMPGGRGMLVYRESVEQFIAAGLDSWIAARDRISESRFGVVVDKNRQTSTNWSVAIPTTSSVVTPPSSAGIRHTSEAQLSKSTIEFIRCHGVSPCVRVLRCLV